MGLKALAILDLATGVMDDEGLPLSGGKVYFYEAGTATLKDTYLDRDKVDKAANPVILDTYGRAEVYGDGLYKIVVKDSADVTLWDIDNVEIVPLEGGTYDNVTINPTNRQPVSGSVITFTTSLTDGDGNTILKLDELQEKIYKIGQDLDATVAVKDPVYYNTSDNEYQKATITGGEVPEGICVSTAGTVVFRGIASGLSGLTPGAVYYLGTSGGISTAASAWRIGRALSATILFVDIMKSGENSDGYVLGDLYLYNKKQWASQQIIKADGTIMKLTANLVADAGIQMDSMEAVGSWTASNADGANLAVNNNFCIEGTASLKIDKTGTVTTSGGMQRTDFTDANLTGKKVRCTVKVPTIASGTLSGVRVWLGSGNGFTNYKYWDITTDVDGRTITANNSEYTVEVDPATAGSSSGGTFDATACDSARVELILSTTSATFAAFSVDHVVIVPGAVELNVNVYKKCATGTLLIKQNADTYTFPALRAGAPVSISTSLDNASVAEGDIIYLVIYSSSTTYGGQGLIILVEMG